MASDKEVVDFLRDLYVENPKRWIKNHDAKRADGGVCRPTDPNAACFCLRGGIRRYALDGSQHTRLFDLIKRFAPNEYTSVPGFNDNPKTTVDAVIHVLKSVSLHLEHSQH